ncbi:hypothetical protein NJB93_07440 [Brucella intermedia]|uniref:hypothetical protein n=1 Tax=Brucella intermedia TaxID=94625 RepID=UPI002097D609|nr:hypothetical protein [Brucella intermedia]MCO7726426.1 hypothetical protein [Brucella intermedia]
MPSKELIAELGEVLFQAEYGEDAGKTCYLKNHYEKLARVAISTIRAALLEPDQSMLGAAEGMCVDGPYLGRLDADLVWCQMLAASALGEQSYG